MSEKNEIIIKLTGSATARKYDVNELFQKEKFKEIKHILEVMLKEISGQDCNSIEECRNHDTIFVDGERGAGKTAFLLNIKDYIVESDKNENEKISNKLMFFKPVDPTLLENSENFLSIVIARIVEEVNSKLRRENNFNKKDKYFRVLNDLGNSIGSIEESKEERGLDEIASYASSIKLEEYAHQFFKIACEIFEVEKLIVLIDDVDMAFDKGFEVLEIIRKYLASPYIIPVVAGDYNLYRDIVRNRFRKQFTYYKEEFKDEMEEKINNITEQYLQKVFPMEFRVELKEIKNIIENSNIKIELDKENKLDFNQVIEFDRDSINLGINRKSEQFDTIEYNARKLTKYLYRKKDILNNFKDEIEKEIIPYINKLKNSYEATAEFYKYDENKEKQLLAKLLDNDVKAFKDDKYYIYEAFINLENIIDTKEVLNEKFYVTKNTKNQNYGQQVLMKLKNSLNGKEKLLLKLFTYNGYIKEDYKTRLFLITGKFLEIIILSLNNFFEERNIPQLKLKKLNSKLSTYNDILNFIDNEINQLTLKIDNELIENITNHITDILYSSPRFIEKNTEETKKNKNSQTTKTTEDSDDNEELDTYIDIDENEIKKLAQEILIWNYYFIRKDFINSTTFYKILGKFFENINVIKNDPKLQKIDRPYNFIIRSVLVLLNSIAYFENANIKKSTDMIAITNVEDCIDKEGNLKFGIIDIKKLFEKDGSIKLNIMPLLQEEISLTKALISHPIIKWVLSNKFDKLNELVKNINELEKIKNKKCKENA